MDIYTTLLAVVPPLLAIILAIATRQVILSLFAAVYVGATMLCDGNPWEGLYSTFFDYILPVDSTAVPQNSLLKEFIGGSCFNT